MKKTILFIVLCITTLSMAQETISEPPQYKDKKNEIKINTFILFFEWINLDYERFINKESSFGVSAILNATTHTFLINKSLTPYYRRYFSEKFARGFFVEGFGMLYSSKTFCIDCESYSGTAFALGISAGGKLVSKGGVTTEVFFGIGRNLTNSKLLWAVGRVGISVGYRF